MSQEIDTEMVERAAQMLYEIDARAWGERITWQQLDHKERDDYLSIAREVLEAALRTTRQTPE